MTLLLIGFWMLAMIVAYRYFARLFPELGCRWDALNRIGVGILCVAGPAAMICAVAVDFSRPMVA